MARGSSLAAALLATLPLMMAAALPQEAGTVVNWPDPGGAYDETGYSRLDEIDVATVGRLALASSLNLPGEGSLEATSVAVDGVLYFTGSLAKVYAVDAVTGKLLWTFDPEPWAFNPFKMNITLYPVNRGVAYAGGRVFVAAMDGRLFALDAKTGKQAWVVESVDRRSMNSSTGAPRAFKDKVIIGNGGADVGARGYVTAYDQASGAKRGASTPRALPKKIAAIRP